VRNHRSPGSGPGQANNDCRRESKNGHIYLAGGEVVLDDLSIAWSSPLRSSGAPASVTNRWTESARRPCERSGQWEPDGQRPGQELKNFRGLLIDVFRNVLGGCRSPPMVVCRSLARGLGPTTAKEGTARKRLRNPNQHQPRVAKSRADSACNCPSCSNRFTQPLYVLLTDKGYGQSTAKRPFRNCMRYFVLEEMGSFPANGSPAGPR